VEVGGAEVQNRFWEDVLSLGPCTLDSGAVYTRLRGRVNFIAKFGRYGSIIGASEDPEKKHQLMY
jgi:hypothetical protein